MSTPTLTYRRRKQAERAGVADPDAAWAVFMERHCPDYEGMDVSMRHGERGGGSFGWTDSKWIEFCRGELG